VVLICVSQNAGKQITGMYYQETIIRRRRQEEEKTGEAFVMVLEDSMVGKMKKNKDQEL
jgi:hypothetical protein